MSEESLYNQDAVNQQLLIDEKVIFFRRTWLVMFLSVLFGILFREEIYKMVLRWNDPSEAHGYLIPLFSIYFIYLQRETIKKLECTPALSGLVLMALSLYGYLWFCQRSFYYPRQVMMISFLGGMVLYIGGWKLARLLWLPVVFLLFAMPIPSRIYTQLTMPMREWSSFVATFILNIFPNVHLEAQGVVIRGTHGADPVNLNVADACSGMRLLRTFVALGVAMAYLEVRPVFHRFALLLSTIPIAIFCNMLRVIITGAVYMFVGKEYAEGFLHTALGFIMLMVAFVLYGLLTWILQNLIIDEDEAEDEAGGVFKVGSTK